MPEPTVPAPIKTRSITVWTPEQAKLFAAKSVATRKALAAQRKLAIKQAAINPFQTIPVQPAAEQLPTPEPDRFASDRLSRVRKQLIHLDKMLASACYLKPEVACEQCGHMVETGVDAAHIDKLASAIARLSEIERQLADRPLPGSRRPAPEKPRSRSQGLLED